MFDLHSKSTVNNKLITVIIIPVYKLTREYFINLYIYLQDLMTKIMIFEFIKVLCFYRNNNNNNKIIIFANWDGRT